MERYRFFYHSNLHLTTILENAISKPLIHKIKENKYLSRLKCKWYIDRLSMYIMRTLKFISQQNWKYIILLSISTHGWNWFPKEMCFIDFLMTLTLQYCNCQYYLSQHKFYFISTKNAEMVSFSSKCSVFSFYVIRQLVLNLRGRSRLFFLFLVIFQTNQVHIWVFISRCHIHSAPTWYIWLYLPIRCFVCALATHWLLNYTFQNFSYFCRLPVHCSS